MEQPSIRRTNNVKSCESRVVHVNKRGMHSQNLPLIRGRVEDAVPSACISLEHLLATAGEVRSDVRVARNRRADRRDLRVASQRRTAVNHKSNRVRDIPGVKLWW